MALFTFPVTSAKGVAFNNAPVQQLDLNKFLGSWYELARFDHSFERGMDNVSADYSLTNEGWIRVVNSGWKDDIFSSAIGKAKQPYPEENPGLLRVSFFWRIYSDYRVLYVDEDYSFALIGSKSSKYLWIMAREPSLNQNSIYFLIDEAKRRGYDTTNLIWTDHSKKRALVGMFK